MSRYQSKSDLKTMVVLGYRALQNKRSALLMVSFWTILIPQIAFFLTFNFATHSALDFTIYHNNSSKLNLFYSLLEKLSSSVFIPFVLTSLTWCLGILMMAKISHNYFSSHQESQFQTLKYSSWILAKKGFGALIMLTLLLPFLTLIPMIRAIVISLLFMLPIALTSDAKSGLRTVWDTLLLRYAAFPKSKWPIFINVLTISGLILSLYLGLSVLIAWIPTSDLLFEVDSSILERVIQIGPISVNSGHFISQILSVVLESFTLAITIPFTAAVYHQVSSPNLIEI